jgi:hypothetical protein
MSLNQEGGGADCSLFPLILVESLKGKGVSLSESFMAKTPAIWYVS